MEKAALTVENLIKVYSKNKSKVSSKALNNLTLKVNQGEVFVLGLTVQENYLLVF